MKREPIFKLTDMFLGLNTLIFFLLAFFGFKENIVYSLVFFGITLFNLFYMIQSIQLRRKFNRLNEKKLMTELEIEEKIKSEEKIDLNYIKQVMLERRIEAEITEGFPNAKTIKNAYIPKASGGYSEIDLIALTEKGIFIIESKNLTGKITGSWKDENIFVEHPGGQTFTLMNPIDQNTRHFQALKNILGFKNDYFRNIVVFGDNSYISDYRDIPFFARICKVDQLIKTMNHLADKFNVELAQHQIENIYETLIEFVKKTDEKEREHIKNIQEFVE